MSIFKLSKINWLLAFLHKSVKSAMNIGYCRVSTDDQNPDLQLATLKQAGCTRICTDKASSARMPL